MNPKLVSENKTSDKLLHPISQAKATFLAKQ